MHTHTHTHTHTHIMYTHTHTYTHSKQGTAASTCAAFCVSIRIFVLVKQVY